MTHLQDAHARVVTAGVPMRIPEATISERVSNGMVFL